jgi:hypothetical protein
MGKAPTTAATTQDDPTAPRPVDGNGFELDRWGLPLVGPARVAALVERTDPEIDPTGWKDLDADAAIAARDAAAEKVADPTPDTPPAPGAPATPEA